ncbi:putative holin-like toxin [Lacticaseibacillus paracasei]|uniref:Putative cytosolic protein n=1 Tax=Lacticaseibacillus paracasei subsp. paracasei Lpp14 TaxID=1256204 RepID=A0A829GSD1_LACPA|nr:putative holin-like toxin [Lacticaseibacillus paracasei]EPC63093.1 putative cytosolic protein [Lacticaseibacillus paracasei subsp. paracasei Lpp14]WKZ95991.1 putative holin-like toxin [Lacticaseibacillus paracasei]
MSVADALMLMLIFGGFILSLIALIITIVVAIIDNQTDRHSTFDEFDGLN